MATTDLAGHLKFTDEEEAALRHLFEHKVFGRYFLSQVARTGLGGPIEFMPKQDTMTMQEFIHRDEDGYYTQPGVEPSWWGFKEAARHLPDATPLIEQARRWGWPKPHPWDAEPATDGVRVPHNDQLEGGA